LIELEGRMTDLGTGTLDEEELLTENPHRHRAKPKPSNNTLTRTNAEWQ